MALRRTSSTRRGSIASSPSGSTTPMSPISRQSTGGSGASGYFASDVDRGQRSRDMNDRILMYLSSEPHQVLPSGKKHYPTYPSVMESAEESGAGTTASSFSDERSGLGKTKGRLTRGWKRMSANLMMKNV
ncbi:unnamed protein product [Zymoseptoria tritici ST99CH_1A5]|nr:unnamed protein product [Zymoseptoria tritici ST99CH_3D7]SMR48155.1 unnamed protein product [Zymoseptoria tritici ST99CH_1E4]SMR49365.1 unnamed protein product [Zymoseptoria tritici ST99CH_3D1]SMY22064.1 unnamed protein product [Zymoseptoria tritici ST99CH_1A5]